MKVYVAGSSDPMERDRIKAWSRRLKICGIDVVSAWLESVEAVGAANPHDMPIHERNVRARECLDAISAADILWFLVPPISRPTRGAWIEFGFMEAARAPTQYAISSGQTKQSIFCALATEFDDDADAFVHILTRLPPR